MGGGGGGDGFKSDPMSRGVFRAFKPAIYSFADQALNMTSQPGYGAPKAPTSPSMSGVLSGVPMYNLPNAVQPTADWWNSLSPDVMAGVWAPWNQAADALTERLGASGQSGNARGGYSGAAGAALGSLGAEAGKQVGLQAWQMSQPGLMADYQAQLGRNQQGYQNRLTESGTDYQNNLNRMMSDYQSQMTAWQLPFQVMMGGQSLTPNSVYQKDTPWWQSMMGMGMSGLGMAGNLGWKPFG